MTFEKTNWQDRVTENQRTYTVQNNPDGSVTFIPKPGAILQEGTPFLAENFNRMDQGIWDAYWQIGPMANSNMTVARSSGFITSMTESIDGVQRRTIVIERMTGLLHSVTTTVYSPDGVTVERQWKDRLIRNNGAIQAVERQVLV